MSIKEQLAGLVDQAAAALVQKWNLHEPDARRMATDVLATLTEQGVVATSDELAVTDGTHCVTCTCAPGMTPAVRFDASPAEREGAVREHLISMGWTPPGETAPAGEVGFKAWLVEQMPTGTVIGNPEWWAERIARAYELNIPQPAPATQGKDAEVMKAALEEIVRRMPEQAGPAWIAKDIAQAALAQQPAAVDDLNAWRAAFVAERAMRYREGGMAIEQARIHAETDAALMEQAASQQQGGES